MKGWEGATRRLLAKQIMAKVTRYHEYSDLEVVMKGIPKYFWKRLMRNWENYVPKRKRKGFDHYKKTHSSQQFLKAFPGVTLDKQVTLEQVMRITIGKKSAARVIYSTAEQKMVITYWYEPYPFPMGWFPLFKGETCPVGLCKHKTYWLEK